MKVLHLINTLSAGGAELHLLTLCRQLKRHRVELVVACLREQVEGSRSLRVDFEKEHIRVLNLQVDGRYDSRFFGRIARVLRQERPTILHTHLPRADLAGAFGRLLYHDVTWVCSVHAIYSDDWAGWWTLPLLAFLWRRADVILCISDAVRDWLLTHGVRPGQSRVIYYGIEPEKFSRPTGDFRAKWGLSESAVVGSIGRLELRKGHIWLIEAMPSLCQRVPNAVMLIAGHDPWGYGKTLSRRIRDLGLKDKVRLVGFQNDIVSFLGTIDVFAFASQSEGFGQVVIEAMAAGKPVVASKIPPLTEIAVGGETALLVDPGKPEAFAQALSRLLSDPEERRRMGSLGQERVRGHFGAQKMADETLLLYDELLRRTNEGKALG